ncbi:MAG: hypothetical protein RLN81_15520 [Balneolaceae bacterium]
MYEEPKEKKSLVQKNTVRVNKSTLRVSSFTVLFDKIHSVSGLQLISALSQIILGTSMVASSLLNVIQPNWLASVMTIVGSLTTVIGLYFVYYILSSTDSFDSLLNKAIKRVINSQN